LSALADIIARETAATGVMPFARFMELALYCPVYGYYETEKDRLGKHGDFYTSVSAGSLFGQLLAFRFAEWLAQFKIQNEKFIIAEGGAHDGKLAANILRWLRSRRPQLFARLEYWIVEPSARRQEWQRETLKDFAPRVRWFASLRAILQNRLAAKTSDSSGICGVIFCNELLDAMPVRRFGWDARQRAWFEWGVAAQDGRFVWARMPGGGESEVRSQKSEVARAFPQVPPALLEVLPDEFTIEISPAAENWWREAAQVLEHGRLMTLDYGLTADELFQPGRTGGTLRAYHRHHLSDDVLANAGAQDITAHVNFAAIQAAGEAAGLKTELFTSQAQFLTRIAGRIWQNPAAFGEWTPGQTRQFQTLTHPEHLGRAFRVLVQARQGRGGRENS
jgi:SAM-dependent MidA family methyltransferase